MKPASKNIAKSAPKKQPGNPPQKKAESKLDLSKNQNGG